jgi:hypothetical protein
MNREVFHESNGFSVFQGLGRPGKLGEDSLVLHFGPIEGHNAHSTAGGFAGFTKKTGLRLKRHAETSPSSFRRGCPAPSDRDTSFHRSPSLRFMRR